MIEIELFRSNPEAIKNDLRKRGKPEMVEWVDSVVVADREWRQLRAQIDSLRAQRNKLSEEIAAAKKVGNEAEAAAKRAEAALIPAKLDELEREAKELSDRIHYFRERIPNILHPSVPLGKSEEDNAEVRRWGKPARPKFELKPHGEILEELGLADFKRAAKVAGAGFVYLKGPLALLDLALQRYALDWLVCRGWSLIEPPLAMRRASYEGATTLEHFETMMYKLEGEDLYLIATAEHPMVASHAGEMIEAARLPIKYCGFSACFRKEVGSHGVDTRGLFRMHQFNKVEQLALCEPGQAWEIHEEMVKNAQSLLKGLGIAHRVVLVCSAETGPTATKQYDIEAWFPRERAYREIGSISNCGSYQATRLGIRWIRGSSRGWVHTLNGTALATSRTMRAIVENFQRKDGSIKIPAVLRPYMAGLKVIAGPPARAPVRARARKKVK